MKQLLNLIFYRPILNLMVVLIVFLPGHSLALSILIITLIIRFALHGLSRASIKSRQDIQKVQPKLKKLQSLYKDDKKRLSEETLKLYQEHKVNPYSGCLPMFVQFAFLIALYAVLRQDLLHLPAKDLYSFAPHITELNKHFLGIDLTQKTHVAWPLSTAAIMTLVLAALTAGLQFYQTKLMMPPKTHQSDDPATQVTQNMLYIMPLLTLSIALSLPPALPFYWVITTLFSIGEQWFFLKKGFISWEVLHEEEDDAEQPQKSLPEVKEESKGKGDVTIRIRSKK